MSFDRQFQYQITTTAPPAAVSGTIEVSWRQLWSSPVRKRVIAAALIAPSFFFSPSPIPPTLFWYRSLEEPVKLKRGLGVYLQRAFTFDAVYGAPPPPGPDRALMYHSWLSEPVRKKIGLQDQLQQTLSHPPRLIPAPSPPVVTDDVFGFGGSFGTIGQFALGEIPQPPVMYNVTVVLSATETNSDVAEFGVVLYYRPRSIRVSIREVPVDRGAFTSIIEE